MSEIFQYRGVLYNVDNFQHGSPWDRGSADSYYNRPLDPHYWPEGTGFGEKITDLTDSQRMEYYAGHEWNEEQGVHKEW